jgi:hypothetical protein
MWFGLLWFGLLVVWFTGGLVYLRFVLVVVDYFAIVQ